MKTQPKPTSTSRSGEPLVIWTIGHSNRPKEVFIDLLRGHQIQVLVDVRSFPTSKISHFKHEEIEEWLPENGIDYVWLGKELEGYRTGGYQSHMKTKLFREGTQKLLEIGTEKQTCIMYMESNPRQCHRHFISAHLEQKHVTVVHITAKAQTSLLKF